MTDPLSDIVVFDPDRYEGIDLDRLTSYAIRVLVDHHVPVTFENIVVALFRMFPRKFGLVGFEHYPDAARVNRALLHCLPKYRNYVAGSARTGFYLTNAGNGAADDAHRLLKSDHVPSSAKRKRAVTPRAVADQFMREVDESPGFKAFKAGSHASVERYDLLRLVHAGPDERSDLVEKRLSELSEYARQTRRDDIDGYLHWLADRYVSQRGANA